MVKNQVKLFHNVQTWSDGCKLENRDILSDFSESHCVRARLAPQKCVTPADQ